MLGEQYLLARGLPLDVAQVNGIEIDPHPERVKIEERLGVNCVPLWTFASEILWFPLYNKERERISWIGRGLPTIGGKPKFVSPTKSSGIPTGIPYTPLRVWRDIGKPINPLIITEGPIKSLVLVQAGVLAIGLNGVFGAQETAPNGKLVLRKELVELGIRGRKVLLCFDADGSSNPEVRLAEIRLWFLLRAAGAEVRKFTSWDESEGKGIDDYLVNATEQDPNQTRKTIVQMLSEDAQPFISSLRKHNTIDLDAVVSELEKVALTAPQRDQLCKELWDPLGVRVEVLRQIGAQQEKDGQSNIGFKELKPWDEEVSGEVLLHDISALVKRHVIVGDHALVADSLWCVMTYLCDVVEFLPVLAILSPQKRCGKTRHLGLLTRLVYKPLPSVFIKAAALYRSIEKWHPTMLLDEADNYLKEDTELHSVINSGHSRDSCWVPRCVGDNHEVQLFSTWTPKVIAQIGKLQPPSLGDRAVIINMVRRTKDEKVEPLRATPPETFEALRRKMMRWATDNATRIATAKPLIPAQLDDRAADNWSPLLAIAEVVGGDWPDLARKAAIMLSGDADDEDSVVSILLACLRALFKSRAMSKKKDFLPTEEILKELNSDEEAPWSDWRGGKGLSAEKLKSLLGRYSVRSIQKQIQGNRARGYEFGDLKPIFDRYLAPKPKPQKP